MPGFPPLQEPLVEARRRVDSGVGRVFRGDVRSADWDGGGDLSTGADATATQGYLVDYSSGSAQFQAIYAEGGTLGDLTLTGNLTIAGDVTLDGGSLWTDDVAPRIGLDASTALRVVAQNSADNDGALSFEDDSNLYTVRLFPSYDTYGGRPLLSMSAADDYAGNGSITLTTGSTLSANSQTTITATMEESARRFRIRYNERVSDTYYVWDPIAIVGQLNTRPLIYLDADSINVTSGQFLADAGSESAPGVGIYGDADTGMYGYGADTLGFTTGGTAKVSFTSEGIRVFNGSAATGNALIQDDAGSASIPTYSFHGDTDTGMYRQGADSIGFATGGARTWIMRRINTDQSQLIPYDNTGNFFDSYLLWDNSLGQWQLASHGVVELFLSNSQFVVPNVYNDSTTGSANVIVASNGRLQRTTSARKYKTDEQDADWLADIALNPVTFRNKQTGTLHAGLIADDVAAQADILGQWVNEEIENYDKDGVLAAVIAKVNRLEKAVWGK